MNKFFLVIGSLVVSTLTWGVNLTGTVKTDTKVPVANVVVSDGYSVVQTDANGEYTMPYNASAAFVFVSLPSGYDMYNSNGLPQMWQKIDKDASTHTHHFTLHQQEDGGKADSAHVLIVFSDPQVLTKYDLWRFKHETLEDVNQLMTTYPAGTKFIGITVGDVVWDEYDFFPNQKKNYEDQPFRNFLAIGNHDHNRKAPQQSDIYQQDSVASLLYESYFGPTYYSFNIGAIHYIVLDNILYKGYAGGDKSYKTELTIKQKNWVTKDIAQLDSGTQVVYAMHSRGKSNTTDYTFLRNLLTNSENYLMTGHTHTSDLNYNGKLIEHNVTATGGYYWCSDWSADGSPNGYKVFETTEKGITNWYYKGTGLDRSFRLKVYPRHAIDAYNGKTDYIIANVWEYEKKCTVQVSENGVLGKMKYFSDGQDPDAYDIMLKEGDTRPNYPGSEGGTAAEKNPGIDKTDHLLSYYPTDTTAQLKVIFTDHFGHQTIVPVLRHQMVASFTEDTTTGTWSYQQDFNWLPAYPNYCTGDDQRGTWIAGHTPLGWYGATCGKVLPSAEKVTWTGFNYLQINGGPLKPWLWSCGNPGAQLEDNSRERALGSLNSSSYKRISYGVIVENNTGSTITSLDIHYTGEVWHVGDDNTAQETLKVSYAILSDAQARKIRDREAWIGEITTTDAPQLNFTTPSNITARGAGQTNVDIDGNNTQNQSQINGKINVSLKPGQVILIRWDDDLATTNDKDQALAIDDVQIIPTLSTNLPETITSLMKNTDVRTILVDGQVLIQTEQNIYTITGQKK